MGVSACGKGEARPEIGGGAAMTTRAHLTRAQKVRVFDAARGRCHICTCKIHAQRGEQWQVEHRVPLWAGGPDTLENMAPAHLSCHQEKTDGEAPIRAKTDRQRANHLGIPKPGKKLPGGRDSPIKKKIAGPVVPRLKRGEEHRLIMAAFPNWRGAE